MEYGLIVCVYCDAVRDKKRRKTSRGVRVVRRSEGRRVQTRKEQKRKKTGVREKKIISGACVTSDRVVTQKKKKDKKR